MAERIAQVWYDGETLITRILEGSKVIITDTREVEPDYLGGNLLAIAGRVDRVVTQNFGYSWIIEDNTRNKKYERQAPK